MWVGGRFTPGKDPVLNVQEFGWAPAPVWTVAENLAHTGIRSANLPAPNESLQRLSHPGPQIKPRTVGKLHKQEDKLYEYASRQKYFSTWQ